MTRFPIVVVVLLFYLLLLSCTTGGAGNEKASPRTQELSPFEEMLSGFTHCKFDNVHMDIQTRMPAHPYLLERRLMPCEVKDELAYFCIDEEFHGLPVSKLMIPASTFDLHGLFIDLSIDEARQIAKERLGSEFRESQASEEGRAPELLVNPRDPERSVFMCNQKIL